MAINFLNTIDLNKNSLDNARIQNLGSDPAGAVEGQIYFNTTDDVLKIYGGGVWSEVGGGVESLVATNSGTTYVSLTPTSAATGAVTITADLNATALTGSIDNTKYLRGDNKWASVTSIYGWTLQGDTGGPSSITNAATVDIAGGGNITTALVGTELTVSLDNNVTIAGSLTVSDDLTVSADAYFNGSAFEINAGTNIDFGANKIANVVNPTNAQDAATKAYVDAATVGGLVYQGGYNASTNVPILDSRGTQIAVEKGWTYTVTDDGTFYGEVVRVGDVLIAEVDLALGAGALTDWTTVQNNIDLASATQVGIGNVAASTAVEYDGLRVTYTNPTDGTATVGLDINSLPTETLNYGASDIQIPYVNDQSGEQKKASLDDLILAAQVALTKTGTIAIGAVTGTVAVPSTWGLNTMVQTVNAAGDTVFCNITRTTTSVVATISAAELTAITILVQKIG